MSMLKHALAAVGAGLPVFPCHPNDKQPLVGSNIKGAGGVKLATTDARQIESWWDFWPDAMIGMRCGTRASGGAGIFVIDIDPKFGATGEATLRRLELFLAERIAGEGMDKPTVKELADSVERALAYELAAPVIVKTPRGGLHLWYRAPDGLDIGNRGNVLKGRVEQIDVRGASRDEATGEYKPGYVIIPPSTRKGPKAVADGCDGVSYQWARGSLEALINAPAEIINLARERERATPPAPGRTYTPSAAMAAIDNTDARQAAIRKHVAAALEGELARARSHKGNRNNDLNSASVSLGKLIPFGFLIEHEVRGLLEQEAVKNGLVADDGLHSVRATIDSGIEYGKRNPRDLAEVGQLAGRGLRAPPVTAPVYAENPSYAIFSDQKSPQPLVGGEAWPADYPAGERQASAGDDEPPAPPPIDEPPDDGGDGEFDSAKLAEAAQKEVNDTGNAERFLLWHGEEFLNVNVAEAMNGAIGLHIWAGTHWESKEAPYAINRLAQRVPPLIQLESILIEASDIESEHMRAGAEAVDALTTARAELEAAADKAAQKPIRARIVQLEAMRDRGVAAKLALQSRKSARVKFGKSSGNKSRIDAMTALAVSHVTWPPDKMDADPLLINCRNGTLRITKHKNAEGKTDCSFELQPHTRGDLITKLMEVDYDPAATAPRWLAFVEKVQPKQENLAFLQTWHGLALTGMTEQAFVLNYGTGANGKTTFIETIARMQGGYAETLPAEALTGDGQRRGDQATPELARLAGARLVRCSELPRGQGFRESVLKLLTGGDSVPVRQLHGRFWDLKPQFKAVGVCNEKPDISGVDEGIWRRVKLVNWDVAIPPHERRPMDDVLNEFAEERAGILNWLLAGLQAYIREGALKVPADVMAATESYREDMDPVGSFVEACVVRAVGRQITAHHMYKSFAAYCHANSLRVMSQKNFGQILATKKVGDPPQEILKDRAAVTFYRDVELHDVPDDPTPDRDVKWSGGMRTRSRDDLGYIRTAMPPADFSPPKIPTPPDLAQPIGPDAPSEAIDD